uniref:Uncharacterized protein n=1 Tax=Amazona collaria TaxID=241587 RepID=A0A8B9FQT5_9PSIT
MHPGKRSSMARSSSSGLIQLPSRLCATAPPAAGEARGAASSGWGALMLENLQKHSTPHATFQPNSQMGEEMSQNSLIKEYLEKQQELLQQRLEREAREAEAEGQPSPKPPQTRPGPPQNEPKVTQNASFWGRTPQQELGRAAPPPRSSRRRRGRGR